MIFTENLFKIASKPTSICYNTCNNYTYRWTHYSSIGSILASIEQVNTSLANYVPNATKWNGIDFREVKCIGDCAICTPKDIGLKKGQDPDEGQDLDAKYIANPDSSTKTEVRLIKPGMIVHLLLFNMTENLSV